MKSTRCIFLSIFTFVLALSGTVQTGAAQSERKPVSSASLPVAQQAIDAISAEILSLAALPILPPFEHAKTEDVLAAHQQSQKFMARLRNTDSMNTVDWLAMLHEMWQHSQPSSRATWLFQGEGLTRLTERLVLLSHDQEMRSSCRRFVDASIGAAQKIEHPVRVRQLMLTATWVDANLRLANGDTVDAVASFLEVANQSRTQFAGEASQILVDYFAARADTAQWFPALARLYLQTGQIRRHQIYEQLTKLFAGYVDQYAQLPDIVPDSTAADESSLHITTLDDYLDRQFALLYERSIAVEPAPTGSKRVTIVEYSTGIKCSSCWYEDRAFHALNRRYPSDEVIPLAFHGNYPIGNRADSAWIRRDAWYPWPRNEPKFRGLHSSVLPARTGFLGNGQPVGGSERINGQGLPEKPHGLSIPQEQYLYLESVRILDSLRKTRPRAEMRLSVTRSNDSVRTSISVDSLHGFGNLLALRIVLFEDTVRIRGASIRRIFQNVVRAFAQTEQLPLGMPFDQSRASPVEYVFDLAKIRAELMETHRLEQRESDSGSSENEFPDLRDWSMDDRRLYVVAFVQDLRTGEIYQAVRSRVPSGSP